MAKKEKNKIREKLELAMEIPKELLKNYSRITIIGAEDVLIENYESILEYEDDYIRLSNDIGIYGLGLKVEEINEEDILIVGNIKKIEFE